MLILKANALVNNTRRGNKVERCEWCVRLGFCEGRKRGKKGGKLNNAIMDSLS